MSSKDCGPTCLQMIASYHGRHLNLENLRALSSINKEGVSLLGLSEAAEAIGYKTICTRISYDQLIRQAPLPCIIHWNQDHFVVVTTKATRGRVTVADPAKGKIHYSRMEFCNRWLGVDYSDSDKGITLLLEPTPAFFEFPEDTVVKMGWGFLLKYIKQYKRYLMQIFLSLILGSLIQLVFPFLTQSIVDIGINERNIHYIYLVLIAQLMLFVGRTSVEFIRSRLLLHISMWINISIITDFWIKLMRLPISFFDTKLTGDIMQRINDHHRIENFLTYTSSSVLFSVINLLVFSIVLVIYNSTVFWIFVTGSILYVVWISLFLRYRRQLDLRRFEISSKENGLALQFVYGMPEIKLNNAAKLKRWKWEALQAQLFKMNFKNLSINQYQHAGAVFINEGKNIIITFLVATAVINGQLTLGAMIAIQYIIGQLNSPVEQLIGFIQTAQDAKLSLERLCEIHQMEDEEPASATFIRDLPHERSVKLNGLSFKYPGAGNESVLKGVDLVIPAGEVTAIVGMSGSGKTTLLKLLLKFYDNYAGEIKIGASSLKYISAEFWRDQCGSVMQDGFIFSDTIASNIAVGDAYPNFERLIYSCKVANILSFIEGLPLAFNTIIGSDGNGLSQGQKQRILIARAVYKEPQYLLFDEATNALDANNEKAIMENLNEFFKGRTVVVVAHRLSTVKNADNIVVLHQGVVVECGSHAELSQQRGHYYSLVKNQLDLGN